MNPYGLNPFFSSQGLEERPIHSAEQIFQAMREGEDIRKFGVTNMNDHSSRSHTIFRIIIESCMKIEGKKIYSTQYSQINSKTIEKGPRYSLF